MKYVHLIVIALISFMICISGCSNSEEETIHQPEPRERMIITALHGNTPSSRVVYEDDGLTMKWTEGDSFALYGDDRQGFTLVSGFEGSTSGEFEGITPEGTPQKAFYPFSKSNAGNWNDCMLNVTGQKQTVNGSMGHLPSYTFMSGDITVGNDFKKTVDFTHQTTLMKFVLILPENIRASETLQAFHLSTNQVGAFTLQKGVGGSSTVEVKKGKVISMDITGMDVGNDNKITLYMMVLPFILDENSKLIFTIETKLNSKDEQRFYDFTANITGNGEKSYEAGLRYTADNVTLQPVVYNKSDAEKLYPTKLTNTTTGDFYYIVSPEGDTLFKQSERVAYVINDNNWNFIYNNSESISMSTILNMSNAVSYADSEYKSIMEPEFAGNIWGDFDGTYARGFVFSKKDEKNYVKYYLLNQNISGYEYLICLVRITNK